MTQFINKRKNLFFVAYVILSFFFISSLFSCFKIDENDDGGTSGDDDLLGTSSQQTPTPPLSHTNNNPPATSSSSDLSSSSPSDDVTWIKDNVITDEKIEQMSFNEASVSGKKIGPYYNTDKKKFIDESLENMTGQSEKEFKKIQGINPAVAMIVGLTGCSMWAHTVFDACNNNKIISKSEFLNIINDFYKAKNIINKSADEIVNNINNVYNTNISFNLLNFSFLKIGIGTIIACIKSGIFDQLANNPMFPIDKGLINSIKNLEPYHAEALEVIFGEALKASTPQDFFKNFVIGFFSVQGIAPQSAAKNFKLKQVVIDKPENLHKYIKSQLLEDKAVIFCGKGGDHYVSIVGYDDENSEYTYIDNDKKPHTLTLEQIEGTDFGKVKEQFTTKNIATLVGTHELANLFMNLTNTLILPTIFNNYDSTQFANFANEIIWPQYRSGKNGDYVLLSS